jgi:hypothetical protein
MSWGRGGFEEGERHLKRDYEWGGGKIQQTDGRGRALAAKTLSDGWWSDRGGAIPSPGGQFAVVCSHQYEVGPSVSRRRRGPAGLLRHQQAGGSLMLHHADPASPSCACAVWGGQHPSHPGARPAWASGVAAVASKARCIPTRGSPACLFGSWSRPWTIQITHLTKGTDGHCL